MRSPIAGMQKHVNRSCLAVQLSSYGMSVKLSHRPMLLIGGSCDRPQEELGAFQETRQVEAANLFAKFSARPNNVDRIPFYVQKAIRMATYGRPGSQNIKNTISYKYN